MSVSHRHGWHLALKTLCHPSASRLCESTSMPIALGRLAARHRFRAHLRMSCTDFKPLHIRRRTASTALGKVRRVHRKSDDPSELSVVSGPMWSSTHRDTGGVQAIAPARERGCYRYVRTSTRLHLLASSAWTHAKLAHRLTTNWSRRHASEVPRASISTRSSSRRPGFYQRRGYHVYGVLEGFSPGSRRLYLRKDLTAPGTI